MFTDTSGSAVASHRDKLLDLSEVRQNPLTNGRIGMSAVGGAGLLDMALNVEFLELLQGPFMARVATPRISVS
jgi:hypothetical protein